jgi:hypothetical protein
MKYNDSKAIMLQLVFQATRDQNNASKFSIFGARGAVFCDTEGLETC